MRFFTSFRMTRGWRTRLDSPGRRDGGLETSMTRTAHDFQTTVKHPVYHAAADRQLGIGVVGLNEGQTLLTGLSRAAHACPVAGCDLSDEKLTETRAAHPDLFLTMRYDELLARPDVDIVVIYTPDQLHGMQIAQAMKAGK